MKAFTISLNDANQRLDKFVSKSAPFLPSSLMYKYIRLKRIKVNGKKSDIAQKLNVGDIVEMYIGDEFFPSGEGDYPFLHAKHSPDVVFEDDNVILVNKPAGLIAHEDKNEKYDTLINAIKLYLYNKKEYLPENENSFAVSLCNRIDRNTSGIVIAAKNAEALRILNEKIKNREIKKYYLCIVKGTPSPKEGTLKNYLLKDAASNTVACVPEKTPGALTAITKYRVIDSRNGYSLLHIELLTGRTHQIRAQFAQIGHPLLGDTKYGRVKDFRSTGFYRQALCSYKLTFDFSSDAGILQYLSKKTFELDSVPFTEAFYNGNIR